MSEFVTWSKIPRLHREWQFTEKVDGTNGVLYWGKHDGRYDDAHWLARVGDLFLKAGSRNRWLTPRNDNFGFAQWAVDNAPGLYGLGKGRHFGEWYGKGIQRGYGLDHKRFALFDQDWADVLDPDIAVDTVDVVPVIWTQDGQYLNEGVATALDILRSEGSRISKGFMRPEGIIARHVQHGSRFKVLLEGDSTPKSLMMGACDA